MSLVMLGAIPLMVLANAIQMMVLLLSLKKVGRWNWSECYMIVVVVVVVVVAGGGGGFVYLYSLVQLLGKLLAAMGTFYVTGADLCLLRLYPVDCWLLKCGNLSVWRRLFIPLLHFECFNRMAFFHSSQALQDWIVIKILRFALQLAWSLNQRWTLQTWTCHEY